MGVDTRSLALPEVRQIAEKMLIERGNLPVRTGNGGNGQQHWGRSILLRLEGQIAIVKRPFHGKEERIPLSLIHLWKAAICGGPKPIMSSCEFDQLFSHTSQTKERTMGMMQGSTDSMNLRVIMDVQKQQFYVGPNTPSHLPAFTPDMEQARKYQLDEVSGARKSIGKIRVSHRLQALIHPDPTSLQVLTVREALDALRKGHEVKPVPRSPRKQAMAFLASNGHPTSPEPTPVPPVSPTVPEAIVGISDAGLHLEGIPDYDKAELQFRHAMETVVEAQKMLTDSIEELNKARANLSTAIKMFVVMPQQVSQNLLKDLLAQTFSKISQPTETMPSRLEFDPAT